METLYQIAYSIRAANGYAEIARFQITDSKEEAISLFSQLNGTAAAHESMPGILLQLIDTSEPIDTVLSTLYCTLCDAGDNCQILIRETFRAINIG